MTDDGQGFDLDAVRDGGVGLASMQERAEQIGGHLSVVSVPGEGTRVQVSIGTSGNS